MTRQTDLGVHCLSKSLWQATIFSNIYSTCSKLFTKCFKDIAKRKDPDQTASGVALFV